MEILKKEILSFINVIGKSTITDIIDNKYSFDYCDVLNSEIRNIISTMINGGLVLKNITGRLYLTKKGENYISDYCPF